MSTPATDAFMAKFYAQTLAHPFTRVYRVWGTGERLVSFEVKPFGSNIMLGAIVSMTKGCGAGSEALDWLTALAKEFGVPIRATIQRLGKEGINARALRSWYKRHGFRESRYPHIYFQQ